MSGIGLAVKGVQVSDPGRVLFLTFVCAREFIHNGLPLGRGVGKGGPPILKVGGGSIICPPPLSPLTKNKNTTLGQFAAPPPTFDQICPLPIIKAFDPVCPPPTLLMTFQRPC